MSDVEWFESTIMGMKIFTDSQRKAARFLESKGYRFLVHFGCENCEEKALALADERFVN